VEKNEKRRGIKYCEKKSYGEKQKSRNDWFSKRGTVSSNKLIEKELGEGGRSLLADLRVEKRKKQKKKKEGKVLWGDENPIDLSVQDKAVSEKVLSVQDVGTMPIKGKGGVAQSKIGQQRGEERDRD